MSRIDDTAQILTILNVFSKELFNHCFRFIYKLLLNILGTQNVIWGYTSLSETYTFRPDNPLHSHSYVGRAVNVNWAVRDFQKSRN